MKKKIITSSDSMSIGVGRLTPDTSTRYYLKCLCISIKFLNSHLKSIEVNYAWICQTYSNNMNEVFRKISAKIPVKTSQGFK